MADKQINELDPVKEVPIGDLPQVLDIYDDSLIPLEQQGMAMRMTGKQFRQFGEKTAEIYVQGAKDAAENAKTAQTGAETARDAAAQSAVNAAASETAAGESKDAAAASQAAAKTSEDNAKTAQTAAETARDAARASENTAKGHADAAKTAQTAAETAKDAAKASQTAAAGSADAAAKSATAADASKTAAAGSASAAAQSATNAAASAKSVEDMARTAESYAVGGTDTRPNEDADNAKYYYEQAKGISQGLQGALLPMGTVSFDELSAQTKEPGYMYNISDAFTTDATFKEGAGHPYPAGTNVYWTADGAWDCLAGTMVTSVNGEIGDVTTVSSVNGGTGDVEIGGRNLLLLSDVEKESSAYNLAIWSTSIEEMETGVPYTITYCITPASDVERVSLHKNLGNGSLADLPVTGGVKQVVHATFTVPKNFVVPDSIYAGCHPSCFQFPTNSSRTEKSTIHWAKLERGSVPTDWSPAPEDIPGMAPVQSVNGKTGVVQIDSITGNAATATKLSPGKKINNVLFDGSQDITVADSTKVAKTGDTMTGDLTMSGATRAIKFASGTRNGNPITFYNGTVDGSGIVIGDGGRTIVGSGESAQNLHSALGTAASNESAEEMHVCGDGPVYIHTNCQTIASRKTVTFDNTGKITAPGGFAGALTGNVTGNVSGSSSSCTGNAATATQADHTKAALTFTGGVNGTFNGSAALSVAIPTTLPANGGTSASCTGNAATATTASKVAHKLTFTGGATGDYDGSAAKSVAIPTIPNAIKNPQALKFTGAVNDSYDGSVAKTVNIPTKPEFLVEKFKGHITSTTYGNNSGLVPITAPNGYSFVTYLWVQSIGNIWTAYVDIEYSTETTALVWSVERDKDVYVMALFMKN